MLTEFFYLLRVPVDVAMTTAAIFVVANKFRAERSWTKLAMSLPEVMFHSEIERVIHLGLLGRPDIPAVFVFSRFRRHEGVLFC